jgi:hypothetical protein
LVSQRFQVLSEIDTKVRLLVIHIAPCPITALEGLFRNELRWLVGQRSEAF